MVYIREDLLMINIIWKRNLNYFGWFLVGNGEVVEILGS